jgi:lipid II:glycine glycyltransferase (peptidoglycan interpeptide bridge formation enzyme)
MGIIETMGKLVNIDLMQDLQTQRGQYQKRLRTYISKCRSLYTIKEAETDAEINVFIDMYYENMQRVNAKKHYFFNREYFFNLLKSNRFDTTILLALDNETKEIMGGAMFIKKNRIVQYHLSGVKAQHLHLNPVKVLIDEMRIRSTAEHYTYFNLGGGLGSKEDSLFQFKSGFSHNYKFFKLWKYIVNEEVYEALVARKNQMECGRFAKNCPNYFPCYRCNPHNH